MLYHDPLLCGWLVVRELKVDDPITAQPGQERVHIMHRWSMAAHPRAMRHALSTQRGRLRSIARPRLLLLEHMYYN
jgi:hypothetical protein